MKVRILNLWSKYHDDAMLEIFGSVECIVERRAESQEESDAGDLAHATELAEKLSTRLEEYLRNAGVAVVPPNERTRAEANLLVEMEPSAISVQDSLRIAGTVILLIVEMMAPVG